MNNLATLRAVLERALLRRSFADYVRAAWPHVEPTRSLLPSVAMDALCAALQAVAERRIRRLAIATCPGTSKSLVAAVMYPPWLFLRSGGTARVMVGSYSHDFAARDSRRCRDLMATAWYRDLVGNAWLVRDDADRLGDFWTTASGRRLIVSVGGRAIGERCTVQIVDDALSGADVHSPAAKKEAARWIAEVLPSRLEDPEGDPRVVIGQRLAVDDPLAACLERGWSYLSLPAVLAEGDEPCVLLADDGSEVWRDPRGPGQPLLELLGTAALDGLKLELGSAAFTAQYLQKPSDDSTAAIKRSWWRFHRPAHVAENTPRPTGCTTADLAPAIETPKHFTNVVIAVDMTFGATGAKNDYAVIQAWGSLGAGRYLLAQWRAKATQLVQQEAIRQMRREYPGAPIIVEKAAGGQGAVELITAEGFTGVIGVTTGGKSKAQRLSLVTPAIEAGNCYLPLGANWLGDYVEELAGATKHDDAQDATAYALARLALKEHQTAVPDGGWSADDDYWPQFDPAWPS